MAIFHSKRLFHEPRVVFHQDIREFENSDRLPDCCMSVETNVDIVTNRVTNRFETVQSVAQSVVPTHVAPVRSKWTRLECCVAFIDVLFSVFGKFCWGSAMDIPVSADLVPHFATHQFIHRLIECFAGDIPK